jgi:hypothetical protein
MLRSFCREPDRAGFAKHNNSKCRVFYNPAGSEGAPRLDSPSRPSKDDPGVDAMPTTCVRVVTKGHDAVEWWIGVFAPRRSNAAMWGARKISVVERSYDDAAAEDGGHWRCSASPEQGTREKTRFVSLLRPGHSSTVTFSPRRFASRCGEKTLVASVEIHKTQSTFLECIPGRKSDLRSNRFGWILHFCLAACLRRESH